MNVNIILELKLDIVNQDQRELTKFKVFSKWLKIKIINFIIYFIRVLDNGE